MQDNALNLTLRVLLAIKASQIEQAVGSLDRDLVDVLMKYVYRGFESPSEGSSGHLLLWHEKAYVVGGVGSIMRVLSDTKRAWIVWTIMSPKIVSNNMPLIVHVHTISQDCTYDSEWKKRHCLCIRCWWNLL